MFQAWRLKARLSKVIGKILRITSSDLSCRRERDSVRHPVAGKRPTTQASPRLYRKIDGTEVGFGKQVLLLLRPPKTPRAHGPDRHPTPHPIGGRDHSLTQNYKQTIQTNHVNQSDGETVGHHAICSTL
jgi:hypothetical protein